MNMNVYAACLVAALLIGTAAYALRLRSRGMKLSAALLALPLSVALGYGLAWGAYAVLQMNVRLSVFRFSFFGGAAGVLIGVLAGAKLTRQSVAKCLDAYAPVFALEVAMARAGEYFMGDVGLGHYTEVGWMCRFPFAMVNEWNEWYVAVFMLEALFALIVFAVALILERGKRQPSGMMLERVIFMLCVPQVLCEQLRTMTMSWGFVRVEQVLCAVILLALLILGCVRLFRAEERGAAVFVPIVLQALLSGIVMAMEFALDGKIQMPIPLVWAIMIAALVAMLAVQHWVISRRIERSSAA